MCPLQKMRTAILIAIAWIVVLLLIFIVSKRRLLEKLVICILLSLLVSIVMLVMTKCSKNKVVDPSLLQIGKLLSIPKNQPFCITNLLKFKDKEKYLRYAKWAESLMKDYGIGRITDVHTVDFTLIGNPLHEFDEMFIVRYPSIDAAMK